MYKLIDWGKPNILLWSFQVLLLIYIVIIAWPGHFYFLNDDFIHIPIAGTGNIAKGSLLRPISDLSLWLDFKYWGKNAFGYHLTNLLIHISNSTLLFLFLLRFYSSNGGGRSKVKALFSASLFLVYAYHSESIFWIIGRGGSLTTFFMLLSLSSLTFLQYKTWGTITALFFFTIGFFTYETIWVFPIILGLAWVFNINLGIDRVRLILFGITFLILLYVRFTILAKPIDGYEAGTIINFNLSKLLYNGAALFSRCFIPPLANSYIFSLLFGVVVIVLFLSIRLAKDKLVYFYFFALLISLFPVISLGIDTHDSESERFIYMATVFAVLLISELLFKLRENRIFMLGGLLIAFHCMLLYQNSLDYKFSGIISNQSLLCLKAVQKKHLVVYNLPAQYKGAFIFRIGFTDALRWINDQRFDTIEVKNVKSFNAKFSSLKCNNTTTLSHTGNASIISWVSDSLNFTE
jgi:hypothetical protein